MKRNDISKDLKNYQLKRNAKDIQKIITLIKETMNPFSETVPKDELFNISSGKAASSETSTFLLGCQKLGSDAREKFIKECRADEKRFEQKITQQKVKTFANEGCKYVKKSKDNKIIQLTMERDLFGSILFIALQRKIDMGEILKYPLTPVPSSLCHIDGNMNKTPKAKLLDHLEKTTTVSRHPVTVHVLIIDGMFFLHLLQDLPETYGSISRFILKRICTLRASRIDVVFDKFVTPSIKDSERDHRAHGAAINVAFEILGSSQKRPNNFREALRNNQFKEAFISFLVDSWNDNANAHILSNIELLATCKDLCYKYAAVNGQVTRTEINSMRSSHEEADSRMLFHAKSILGPKNVVIRTADADVAFICLANLEKLHPTIELWVEVGRFTQNTLRYIHINTMHQQLGSQLCKALPGYHGFSCCDFTAAFIRKGKVIPFKKLKKNPAAIEVFANLGKSEEVTDQDCKVIEKYVCEIYSKPKLDSVNDARLEMFLNKYNPTGEKPIFLSEKDGCYFAATVLLRRK